MKKCYNYKVWVLVGELVLRKYKEMNKTSREVLSELGKVLSIRIYKRLI